MPEAISHGKSFQAAYDVQLADDCLGGGGGGSPTGAGNENPLKLPVTPWTHVARLVGTSGSYFQVLPVFASGKVEVIVSSSIMTVTNVPVGSA